MAQKASLETKKCITPEFRVSFPHVFEAHSGFEGQEPKYSIVMLFPKTTDLKELKRAALNAAVEKFGPKEKWPKNLRLPFRDGDEKTDLQGYEGHTFVTASSKQRPGIINGQKVPIAKEDETFYAGCYARASLIAHGYDKAGNKGVAFTLQNIQKLRDGEPFSGRKKAEDEFDSVEDGSENPESYETDSESDEALGFK